MKKILTEQEFQSQPKHKFAQYPEQYRATFFNFSGVRQTAWFRSTYRDAHQKVSDRCLAMFPGAKIISVALA